MTIPRTTRAGLLLALGAATISGFAVSLNAIAVKAAPGPVAFTTAKNIIAALLIGAVLLLGPARAQARPALRALRPRQWATLGYVGVVSGGIAFALFFSGLFVAAGTEAAFLQKSLIIWVALLAVPLLHERVSLPAVGAVVALVVGQALLLLANPRGGAASAVGLVMVLAATLLWSGEIVLVRGQLTSLPAPLLGAVRMGAGSLVLLGFLGASGDLGQLAAVPWPWVLLTGAILSGYVLTWFGALRRAPAIDVTAVLVLGAFITAMLAMPAVTTVSAVQSAGLILIAGGAAVFVRLRWQGAP